MNISPNTTVEAPGLEQNNSINYSGEIEDNDKEEFCGVSSYGACEENSDCKIGGCSSQLCYSRDEEPMATTCEWQDCYNRVKYDMKCGCYEGECQWISEANSEDDDEDKENGKGIGQRIREAVQEKNRIRQQARNQTECPENCTCTGAVTTCPLENGGRQMTIRAEESGNIIVKTSGANMTTNVTLYHHNGKVYGNFKDNETKEIIMPDKIKEKVKEKIKQKKFPHNITLTEEGYYQVQAQKKARLFFLFPVRERVNAEIDAGTGEIVKIRNPWWGFLARDVVEED